MSAQLNIEPLSNAVQRLDEGLHRYLQNKEDIQIRDGLVQRFEFTYELTHKTLKRFMALTGANPEDIAQMAFSDLIRTGNTQGLLSKDWAEWRGLGKCAGRPATPMMSESHSKSLRKFQRFSVRRNFFCSSFKAA